MAHYKHAVILGGSFSGLLAARVLADHAERVTIIERGNITSDLSPRKYCPQGMHIHSLLIRGKHILCTLFPNLLGELLNSGAELIYSNEVAVFQAGYWKARTDFDGQYLALLCSRSLLEWHIAKNVLAFKNIQVLENTNITNLSVEHGIIKGVHTNNAFIAADIVIDAMGRASKTSHWLAENGFDAPEESTINVNVAYSSCYFQRPKANSNWRALQIIPEVPKEKLMGAIFPIENDRWLVTLASWFSEKIPSNHEEFLALAKDQLSVTDLYDAIKNLTPLTQIYHYNFPSSRRRHYEKLNRMPMGLLVIGDAVASFNPIYAQGLTVAALQIQTLSTCLKNNSLLSKIQQQIIKDIEAPWKISTSSDQLFPESGCDANFFIRVMHWYMNKLHAASSHDLKVLQISSEVHNLLRSPLALLRPDIIVRTLLGASYT